MFRVFLFVFSVIVSKVQCEYSMYVAFGAPMDCDYSSIYNKTTVDTWDKCIKLCYDTYSCVFAYNQADDDENYGGCQIFHYDTCYSIEKYDADTAGGEKVAFKVSVANSSVCPAEEDSPLFKVDTPIEVKLSSSLSKAAQPSYEIVLEETSWEFTYKSKDPCTDGHYVYSRPSGFICQRPLVFRNGCVHENITLHCKNLSATLTGFGSKKEMDDSLTVMLKGAIKFNHTEQLAWLDGTRKPECQGSDWKSVAGCESFNAFTYIDQYNTYINDYVWEDGAPFGENCLAMWVRSESNPSLVGKVRDVNCTLKCKPPLCFSAISCMQQLSQP